MIIKDGLNTGKTGTRMLQITMFNENRVHRDSNELHFCDMNHHPIRVLCQVEVLMGAIGKPKLRRFNSCSNDDYARPGFFAVVCNFSEDFRMISTMSGQDPTKM